MKTIFLFLSFALSSVVCMAQFPQEADYFITKWNSGAEGSILLPFTGNYTVTWTAVDNPASAGTETYTGITSNPPTLTLPSAGDYILKVASTSSSGIVGSGFPAALNASKSKLLEVQQWGTNKWSTASQMFDGCVNMDITASDVPDFSNVKIMNSMFSNCEKMKGESCDFELWDVSNVTGMSQTFNNCKLFNRPLNGWVTSSLKLTYRTFNNASAFNQPLNNWNTSLVTNMKQMLYNTSSFNQDLGDWNLKSISGGNLDNLFSLSGLSKENYDATLIGWAANSNTPNDLTFTATDMVYTTNAVEARNALIAKGWTIAGDLFDNGTSTVSLQNRENKMFASYVGGQIIVNNVNNGDKLYLLDVSGRVVSSQNADADQVILDAIRPGLYVLNNITTDRHLKILAQE